MLAIYLCAGLFGCPTEAGLFILAWPIALHKRSVFYNLANCSYDDGIFSQQL